MIDTVLTVYITTPTKILAISNRPSSLHGLDETQLSNALAARATRAIAGYGDEDAHATFCTHSEHLNLSPSCRQNRLGISAMKCRTARGNQVEFQRRERSLICRVRLCRCVQAQELLECTLRSFAKPRNKLSRLNNELVDLDNGSLRPTNSSQATRHVANPSNTLYMKRFLRTIRILHPKLLSTHPIHNLPDPQETIYLSFQRLHIHKLRFIKTLRPDLEQVARISY